ncbi:glycosyltransferase family 2 protein [Magnetococcus sp. PR-3]|uniref:glycosyltransferase family 2 protein n=1 Tax=Magnetococcus sp. PR-3 TaxID=3120355 RepID=UPI002FCE422B
MQKTKKGSRDPTVPTVSFVMSVRDGELFLREAVESILTQSFGDFECIIVDSASTDSTPHILKELAGQDARIVLQHLSDPSTTQAQALNHGLQQARGHWIARMDADDCCHPQRLAKQLAYLSEHPKVGLLGCGSRVVDRSGVLQQELIPPVQDLAIRWVWLCHNPFYHASVIFRRLLPNGKPVRYNPTYRFHSDYQLWGEMMQVMEVANLDALLMDQRDHSDNSSLRQHGESRDAARQQVKANLEALMPDQLWSEISVKKLRNMVRYPPYLKDYRTMREAMEVLHVWHRFAKRHKKHPKRQHKIVVKELIILFMSAIPMAHMFQAWRSGLLKELWRMDRGVVVSHLKSRFLAISSSAG